MERWLRWLAAILVVAAVSTIIYARMQHNPPILWAGGFAGLMGLSLVGVLWLVGEYPDEDEN